MADTQELTPTEAQIEFLKVKAAAEKETKTQEAPDPFAGKEPSFEEYSRFREGDAEKTVTPAAEAETVEGKEPPKEAEQEKTEKERDEHGKFSKKVEFTPEQQEAFDRAFRKREAKLRREFEERYAKTSEPQATAAEKQETASVNEPPKKPELPKLSTYTGTIEEYDKEVAEYPAKLSAFLEAEQKSKKRFEEINNRLSQSEAKTLKAHPDYGEAFEALRKDILNDEEPNLPPYVIAAISEQADNPHEVTYYLAKNRDEFRRIAALEPHQVLREVLKLELKMSQPAPAPDKKPATPKPEPPKTVGARAAASVFDVNDDKTSPDEWARQRNEQIRKARGR